MVTNLTKLPFIIDYELERNISIWKHFQKTLFTVAGMLKTQVRPW